MHKNKKYFLIAGAIFFLLGAVLFIPETQAAALDYQLLEKIPGTDNISGSDLKAYIEALYKIALILVSLSAVLMLSIGGFLYMTSAGNTSRMGTAKEIIIDSLIGLVIALTAWLLLNVINPDLVNITLTGLPGGVETQIPREGAPPAPPEVGVYTNAEAVAALGAAGIGVKSSGNCSDQLKPECTSLENIPKSTIAYLIQLKTLAGCGFNVTGGTEVGHSSHGSNLPVVDVSQEACLSNYLQRARNSGTLISTAKIQKICAPRDARPIAFNCSSVESQPHFHLVFNP